MKGEKFETPNNPCTKGHYPTMRYAKTGLCVDCVKERNDRQTPEQRAEHNRKSWERSMQINPTKPYVFKRSLTEVQQYLQLQLGKLATADNTDSLQWNGIKEQLAQIERALNYRKEK